MNLPHTPQHKLDQDMGAHKRRKPTLQEQMYQNDCSRELRTSEQFCFILFFFELKSTLILQNTQYYKEYFQYNTHKKT